MVMAEKNNRELLWTEKRIAYNNTWPEAGKWYSDVQQMLDEWLKEQGIIQIFEPVKLSEGAKDILFPNAKLNKVFSGIVDIYDELPYRPDEGFDIAWRSLEIFMNHHRSIAWPKDVDKATHLIMRTVKDLIMPLINKDLKVKEMWERFLSEIVNDNSITIDLSNGLAQSSDIVIFGLCNIVYQQVLIIMEFEAIDWKVSPKSEYGSNLLLQRCNMEIPF